MRVRTGLAVLPLVLVPLVACAPQDDDSGSSATDETSSAPTATESAGTTTSASPVDACATDQLNLKTAGQLTVGTDSPAYDPWFKGNDPSNGKGYESAVAYEVAKRLGFGADQVTWVKVPFNTSYKPGDKDFDFDINQITITPERAEVVDFSDSYYDGSQGIIAMKDSDVAKATSVDDLASFKLGAQTGTTSLSAARDIVSDPMVFEDTNAAKQALVNGQVDAIVADLPTAVFISEAEIKNSTVVGQFIDPKIGPDQFGMLFAKGNPLVSCVNSALAAMTSDGTIDALQAQWLADYQAVPVLQ
ncbi:MAG TPA: ABC transporter substrate-binding protein [Nocardioides sp.]|uniref:ABC transporter substrate-binding protein n=1 Tax=Nocardioides sp. TaxID=35761 RepID=UPI002E3139F1|nr:ABC transporter substrate-binding protein [Nocardioides sp.]HEX5087398.1 ABC transporter substrate-binding protein [Nocardioides sp.]